jgi:ribonuclease E
MPVVAPEAGVPVPAEAPRPPREAAAGEEEEKRARRRRRRGKRGGRRRGRGGGAQIVAVAEEIPAAAPGAEAEAVEIAAEAGEAAAPAPGKEGRPARRGRRRRRRGHAIEEGPSAPRIAQEMGGPEMAGPEMGGPETGAPAGPQGGNGERTPSEVRGFEPGEPRRGREAPPPMERAAKAEAPSEMAGVEAEAGAAESKTKRRGWWQRLVE